MILEKANSVRPGNAAFSKDAPVYYDVITCSARMERFGDSELQAKGMHTVAERTDSAASVSFMDFSVEAECFGADSFRRRKTNEHGR